MKTKKPNSYQKLKEKYEKKISELISDIAILVEDIPERDYLKILQTKAKWKLILGFEKSIFPKKETNNDYTDKGNGILSQILNAENNTFDTLDDEKSMALKEVLKDVGFK